MPTFRYTENARRRSVMLKDQPTRPIDKAMFWIEYVIRHRGAGHLRLSSADLHWYQLYLVDVMMVLSLIAYLAYNVICKYMKKKRSARAVRRKMKNKKND